LFNDADYKCGTDQIFSPFAEINDWLGFILKSGNTFASSFGLGACEEVNGLPVLKWGARKRNVIMFVHPFWDLKNIRVDNWLAEIKMEVDDYIRTSGGRLSIVDSFNLHRRPGWCYEKLIMR
jgi:hypothetical protein